MKPEKAWSGNKPNVSHLRVLVVSLMRMYQIKGERSLIIKVRYVYLLTVVLRKKGYKLYDPVKEEVIVSRDVFSTENEAWRWNQTNGVNIDGTLLIETTKESSTTTSQSAEYT